MDVGQAIKAIRLERGMTQTQLAERIFRSTNAVSAMERGVTFPPRQTVELLCQALEVPVAYFLMAAIEECDFPQDKTILYRTQLEPLRRELIGRSEDF